MPGLANKTSDLTVHSAKDKLTLKTHKSTAPAPMESGRRRASKLVSNDLVLNDKEMEKFIKKGVKSHYISEKPKKQ